MTKPNRRTQRLLDALKERLPEATFEVDMPDPKKGGYVDVIVDGQEFTIECPKTGGYGLSSLPAEGFGEGSDEVFDSENELVERLVGRVASRSRTEPQPIGFLRDLRLHRKVPQLEVASRLGVKQPTVSRLEYQSNVNLDTLRKYVKALGGELQVIAKFEDESIDIGVGGDAKKAG